MGTIMSLGLDTSSPQLLLKDGIIRNLFDTTTRKAEVFYKTLVNERTTKDYWERDFRLAGLETATEIAEGQNIPIFKPTIDTYKEYTQRRFGAGVRMTEAMQRFNKYNLWKRWVGQLALKQKEAKDVEVHVLFNSPTSTTLACGTGFDSTYPLGSASHTGLGAGTLGDYNNYLNAALSISAVEDMRYYFATMTDDMGMYMGAKATHLVYQPTLHFTAKQIVGSNYVPFEESNTINIVPEMNLTLVEDPRLTSTTMWFGLAKNDNFDINVFTAQEPDLVIGDAPDTSRDRVATSQQWFTYGFGDSRMYFLGRL
jgi:hypothetical protein